ncbi:hypothetical protein ACIA74_42040 [Streptomyces sp. NPDC051658]|uniref:hypothetical protein n=1 Tax=Streptomyces sp. NPDC051658 TaxID=3365667 RepID=UPI00378CDBCD
MTGAAWLGGCAAASCILCPQPLPVTFRGDKRFCHLSHKVAERVRSRHRLRHAVPESPARDEQAVAMIDGVPGQQVGMTPVPGS